MITVVVLSVTAAVFVTAWVCSKLAERDARRERDAWRRLALRAQR